MPNPVKVRSLIVALLDAGREGLIAELAEGKCPKKYLDFVCSKLPGREDERLTLAESEEQMDEAIRAAYLALTGDEISGDPVDFIHQDEEQTWHS